jgi:hypothetical protein
MSLDDQLPGVRMNLDERLRAASNALREGSATQVDAAGGLREIVHAGRLAAADPVADLPARAMLPLPPGRLPRRTQRMALAVNLVLVLALGVVVGVVGARRGQDVGAPVPSPPAGSVVVTSTVPQTVSRTVVQVPEACLDAAELADEVISRLNRDDRDSRLALALRDYSIASQACRREASTTEKAGP